MSVLVSLVDDKEAGQIYFGAIDTVRVGRLGAGFPSYEIPEKVFAKYDGVCCVINGHYGSPNEKVFDALQRQIESVAGAATHRIIIPEPPQSKQRSSSPPRHDTHHLIIVGDVEAALIALPDLDRPRIMPLILQDAIEIAQELRAPRQPAKPHKIPAGHSAAARLQK